MYKIKIWDNIQYSSQYSLCKDIVSYTTKDIYINKDNIECVEEITVSLASIEGASQTSYVNLFEVWMVSGKKVYTEDWSILPSNDSGDWN
jgi:hypothetical protein